MIGYEHPEFDVSTQQKETGPFSLAEVTDVAQQLVLDWLDPTADPLVFADRITGFEFENESGNGTKRKLIISVRHFETHEELDVRYELHNVHSAPRDIFRDQVLVGKFRPGSDFFVGHSSMWDNLQGIAGVRHNRVTHQEILDDLVSKIRQFKPSPDVSFAVKLGPPKVRQ